MVLSSPDKDNDMDDWTDITISDLNRSQYSGFVRVAREVSDHLCIGGADRADRGQAIEFEIKRYHNLISVTIRPRLHGLGEGNLLRYLTEGDYFHIFLGRRGKVDAVTYPKYCDQYKGRHVHGINYK